MSYTEVNYIENILKILDLHLTKILLYSTGYLLFTNFIYFRTGQILPPNRTNATNKIRQRRQIKPLQANNLQGF